MDWIKLGQVFKVNEFNLLDDHAGFAQSPQAIVFQDFVRVFFSTRQKDSTGKFLSHVFFVDFSKDFQKLIRVSNKPVLQLGGLGSFDEHGIFPLNVLKEKDRILGYTTGWNRKVSVSADASIGLVQSHDGGETFERYGKGPVMTASLKEPFLVSDGFVKNFDGLYHMWYIYGTKWIDSPAEGNPQRVYKIAHATSEDGINWNRDGKTIIQDRIDENECQALPSVIFHKGLYHMFFCYRDAIGFRSDPSKAYRIGYAYSKDLKEWHRDDHKAGIDISSERMGFRNAMLSIRI